MVNKFEAGKFYKSNFGNMPFYVRQINGEEVLIEQPADSIFPERISTINPNKIRKHYYSGFREVSKEEVENLVKRLVNNSEFFRSRL